MKREKIINAWRNGVAFDEMTAEEKAALPTNPAEMPRLDDDALASVTGGCGQGRTSGYCSPCRRIQCF